MNFELSKLNFNKQDLLPYMSVETIEFHYGKHHQTYVTNLNNLIKDTEFENKSLEEIIVNSKGGVFNNAAQVYNHNFFWNCLTNEKNSLLNGKILELINRDFNSFDEFKNQFSNSAISLFGSGWVWLVLNNNKLEIKQYKDANNPLTDNLKPLLTIDVWEHAYYIDYRNARAKFVENFWNIINWNFVNSHL
ncbi:MAG: superoxide dismutase [Bacteroidetes bacterium]|nr:superoxide dismutase [Fe] [Bacteroidota bacterium]